MTSVGGVSDEMPVLTARRAAEIFAESLWAKRRLLRACTLLDRQQARLKESMSDDLKKYCDIVVPALLPLQVSDRAREAARDLGVDLCRSTWHSQPTFDPGRTRFHLEHVLPVSQLRSRAIAADALSGVVEVLLGVRLAWILKEEDRELTRLGHRSKRLDAAAAYSEAGITLSACHPG